MICEAGGQWAWLASGMNFKFIKPVYFDRNRHLRNHHQYPGRPGEPQPLGPYSPIQRKKSSLTADLKGFLPMNKSRSVLSDMIEEGDPTNPLR